MNSLDKQLNDLNKMNFGDEELVMLKSIGDNAFFRRHRKHRLANLSLEEFKEHVSTRNALYDDQEILLNKKELMSLYLIALDNFDEDWQLEIQNRLERLK